MTTTCSVPRQLLAITLLGALGLVLVAPMGHYDHHQAGIAVGTDAQRSDLHVCSSGAHGKGPMGICPICLSQRLLSQAQAEEPAMLAAPSHRSHIVTSQTASVSFGLSHICQPRAPPTA